MVGQDKRKFEEIHALHCLLKTLETGKNVNFNQFQKCTIRFQKYTVIKFYYRKK